jgi:hypothetical protein
MLTPSGLQAMKSTCHIGQALCVPSDIDIIPDFSLDCKHEKGPHHADAAHWV